VGLRGNILKEWAYLDIFDMLAPRYDSPQTIDTLQKWFQEAGMADVVVHYGYNGIEGRGKRALSLKEKAIASHQETLKLLI
jgi:hypothetical protein